MDDNRFRAPVVATLAKRAANTCSNPDCGALTSGPADDPTLSVNVGEAAHIYGANAGSARYRSGMADAERSGITNGIWLCRTCHKLVDDDEGRYEAGLLFEWRLEHERKVSGKLGRPGDEVRRKYLSRHLMEFGPLSYLAEQVISDKPDNWEYRLTAEVLRVKTEPLISRWRFLSKGFYVRPLVSITFEESGPWLSRAMSEVGSITSAFAGIINGEFQRAWGDPGQPGSDVEIMRVCQLFADACQAALEWEERVRFVRLPDEFEPVHTCIVGVMGAQIEEAAKLPRHLVQIFEGPNPSGLHALSLTFSLPEEWEPQFGKAMELTELAISRRG